MKTISELNRKMCDISRNICFIREHSNVDQYFMLSEYQTIKKYGNEPLKMSRTYINEFQKTHSIILPDIVKEIAINSGEHVLSHFLFNSRTKSSFIEPIYIIEENLFIEMIKRGVEPSVIDQFKEDYLIYFNPTINKFSVVEMQNAYEKCGENSDLNFSKILMTCQQVEILLNTENKGKMTYTVIGDRMVDVEGNKVEQPYYQVDNGEYSFETLYITYLENRINLLENKLSKTI